MLSRCHRRATSFLVGLLSSQEWLTENEIIVDHHAAIMLAHATEFFAATAFYDSVVA
jgi:hypothetical protein